MDRLFDDTIDLPSTAFTGGELLACLLDLRSTPDALCGGARSPGIRAEGRGDHGGDGTHMIGGEDRNDERRGRRLGRARDRAAQPGSPTVTLLTGLEAEKAEATFEHGAVRNALPSG